MNEHDELNDLCTWRRFRSVGREVWRWLPDAMRSRPRPFIRRASLVGPGVEDVIEGRTRGKRDIFFVQIGANDGSAGDPLHRLIVENKNWRGIFVEPVKFVFDRLKANYGNDQRFVFMNVAVSDHPGKLPFFYVAENAKSVLPNLPFWYDQLGSFNRQHIVKHLNGVLIPFIVSEDVACVELSEVLADVTKVDVLHIDAEGHDYRILTQVPFATLAPDLIIFEHKHLAEDEREAAHVLLRREGYEIMEIGPDTIATLGTPTKG
jgi:FkbM family methyltransferase